MSGRHRGLRVGGPTDQATVDARTDPPGWRIIDVEAGAGHRAAVAVRAAPGARVRVVVGRLSPSAGPARPGPIAR